MVTTGFSVEGPACGACLAELLEQLRAVDGVTGVAADLAIGSSTLVAVTGGGAADEPAIRRAVERARFRLASADRLVPPHRGSDHLLAAQALARADETELRKEGVRS